MQYVVNIIRRTELQPGDIVVLTTDALLEDAIVKRLQAQLQGMVPRGVRVAVCDGGVKVDGIIGTVAAGQGGGSDL
jgi:hypothetical protein